MRSEEGLYRPCDFCHSKTKETAWYYYKSEVIKRYMKVCICKECSEKDVNVSDRIEVGGIRWKPEST